jgi:hypothetical protein
MNFKSSRSRCVESNQRMSADCIVTLANERGLCGCVGVCKCPFVCGGCTLSAARHLICSKPLLLLVASLPERSPSGVQHRHRDRGYAEHCAQALGAWAACPTATVRMQPCHMVASMSVLAEVVLFCCFPLCLVIGLGSVMAVHVGRNFEITWCLTPLVFPLYIGRVAPFPRLGRQGLVDSLRLFSAVRRRMAGLFPAAYRASIRLM